MGDEDIWGLYEGPRTQIIWLLKNHNSTGIWALKPCDLDPWTLRVRD